MVGDLKRDHICIFAVSWETIQNTMFGMSPVYSSLFHLFTWLPFFSFCIPHSSLSLFLSLLGSRPPSPFTVLLFSLFTLYRNTSTCQLLPQEWYQQSAKIIKNQIGKTSQTSVTLYFYNPWADFSLLSVKRMSYYCHHKGCVFSSISSSVVSRIPQKIHNILLQSMMKKLVGWNLNKVFLSLTVKLKKIKIKYTKLTPAIFESN